MTNPTILIELRTGHRQTVAWEVVCTTDFYSSVEDAIARFADSTGIHPDRIRATIVEG